MYIADLHIHSRYSMATSKEGVPEYLDLWARKKGIDFVGTGDFTHPVWRRELAEKLRPSEEGLYVLKEEYRLADKSRGGEERPRFVISGEISSIYKKHGKTRKVHSLILLPGLDEAERLSKKLEAIGNIHSDGRPILGLDCRDLLEITLDISPRAIFVPAHIWTPHFSMFGAFSGFNSVEECFEDLAPYVRAIETGLSSDPPMNWRISALDRFQMISNSDAHSPAKLGREANLLEIPLCYDGLYEAIQEGKGLKGTIEFFPEEGKYHYDGHRKCHLCLSPSEAQKYGGICPVCGKKLTLGVSHRIEQMSDREEGYRKEGARPFESLVPLPEVIAASSGRSASSAFVQKQYETMINTLGTEFSILRNIPIEEIKKSAGYLISEGIRRLRAKEVERLPGFDGEYGTIKLFEPSELEEAQGQLSMFALAGWEDKKGAEKKSQEAPKERKAVSEEETQEPLLETKGKADNLNSEQLQAVKAVSPRICVVAGPGTGKTKTLVSKILYLLQVRKVKPIKITAVTFTKKAAEEMKNRLKEQLGAQAGRRLQIGTFHSICYELLKKSGEERQLADQMTTLELVKEAAEQLGMKENPRTLLRMISEKKTKNPETENESESEYLDQIFMLYQKKLDGLQAMDFDDLLLKALSLAEDPSFKEQAFSYLFVDEFQDISPIQHRLIEAFSRHGREIFLIGDPDQAIYGFRGADGKSFERFQKERAFEEIRLKKNYRSSPEILTAAQKILSPEKDSFPLEPVKGPGFPVRLAKASKEMGEAVFVAKEINRLIGGIDMVDIEESGVTFDREEARSFSDIAVLYRTHRQAELLEKCLRKEGIPYVVTGREDFLWEPLVRGSLGFFKSILNTEDVLSRNVCQKLLWENEEDAQGRYEELAEKYKKLCKRTQPQKILSQWREDMGCLDDSAMEKLGGISVFYKTMTEFLDNLAFGKESDIKRFGGKTYTSDAVSLMTLHGSKGLEFPAVILYGVRKGTLPLEHRGVCGDVEEERRLLYVGMTRAREELILTTSGEGSLFFEGLPDTVVAPETVRAKKKDSDGMEQLSFHFT